MCAYSWPENTQVHFPPHKVGARAGMCTAKAAAALQQKRGTEHGSPSWPCTLCSHLLSLLLSAENLLLGRLSILKSLSPVFRGTHEMHLKGVGRTRPAAVGTQGLPESLSFYLQGEYCSCSGQPSGCWHHCWCSGRLQGTVGQNGRGQCWD